MNLNINGKDYKVEVEAGMPLLWVLRDVLNMTGTKYGCGVSSCGACTVHVDGIAMRTCVLPAAAFEGKKITTIEGIGTDGNLSAVQAAWIEHQVPQCGYCQPGFIMATAAMLEKLPNPTDEDIDNNIVNVCRCATYYRMRKAIHKAAKINSELSD